jgi:predicted metal-dependent enzyme (double-stranded beta helix superfamily)
VVTRLPSVKSFELDRFIEQCQVAVLESEPWLAVRDVLDEALSNRQAIAAALPVERAELVPLYVGSDVTITKVVWAPGMVFPPHDHLTWACNGLYAGCEHNTLYRWDGDDLRPTGELLIDDGEIGILDVDAIHSVRNPDTRRVCAAIHVYGGDFPSLPRSNWVGEPPQRVAADIELTKQMFADANEGLDPS